MRCQATILVASGAACIIKTIGSMVIILGIGAAAHQKITVLKVRDAQGKSHSVFSSVSELSKIVTSLNCNNLDSINPYEIRLFAKLRKFS